MILSVAQLKVLKQMRGYCFDFLDRTTFRIKNYFTALLEARCYIASCKLSPSQNTSLGHVVETLDPCVFVTIYRVRGCKLKIERECSFFLGGFENLISFTPAHSVR